MNDSLYDSDMIGTTFKPSPITCLPRCFNQENIKEISSANYPQRGLFFFQKTFCDVASLIWQVTCQVREHFKIWVKKMRQLYCFLFFQTLIVAIKVRKLCLNEMSLALFWCIVCSCRLNTTRDIIRNLKSSFSKNVKFAIFWHSYSVKIFQVFNHMSGHIWLTETITQIKGIDISF